MWQVANINMAKFRRADPNHVSISTNQPHASPTATWNHRRAGLLWTKRWS